MPGLPVTFALPSTTSSPTTSPTVNTTPLPDQTEHLPASPAGPSHALTPHLDVPQQATPMHAAPLPDVLGLHGLEPEEHEKVAEALAEHPELTARLVHWDMSMMSPRERGDIVLFSARFPESFMRAAEALQKPGQTREALDALLDLREAPGVLRVAFEALRRLAGGEREREVGPQRWMHDLAELNETDVLQRVCAALQTIPSRRAPLFVDLIRMSNLDRGKPQPISLCAGIELLSGLNTARLHEMTGVFEALGPRVIRVGPFIEALLKTPIGQMQQIAKVAMITAENPLDGRITGAIVDEICRRSRGAPDTLIAAVDTAAEHHAMTWEHVDALLALPEEKRVELATIAGRMLAGQATGERYAHTLDALRGMSRMALSKLSELLPHFDELHDEDRISATTELLKAGIVPTHGITYLDEVVFLMRDLPAEGDGPNFWARYSTYIEFVVPNPELRAQGFAAMRDLQAAGMSPRDVTLRFLCALFELDESEWAPAVALAEQLAGPQGDVQDVTYTLGILFSIPEAKREHVVNCISRIGRGLHFEEIDALAYLLAEDVEADRERMVSLMAHLNYDETLAYDYREATYHALREIDGLQTDVLRLALPRIDQRALGRGAAFARAVIEEINELFGLEAAVPMAENVHDGVRISQTRESILALLHHVPAMGPLTVALNDIGDMLRAFATEHPRHALHKVRANFTEFANAERTLSGEPKDGDFSQALTQNDPFVVTHNLTVGLGDLTARVYAAVRAFPDAKERELMDEALIRALAECIEDDGHRVCGVGMTQRLLTVLQGRYDFVKIDEAPTPGQLVSAAAERFAKSLGERTASDSDVAAFFADTLENAGQMYGKTTPEWARVESQLLAYLKRDYEWEPPSDANQAQS